LRIDLKIISFIYLNLIDFIIIMLYYSVYGLSFITAIFNFDKLYMMDGTQV